MSNLSAQSSSTLSTVSPMETTTQFGGSNNYYIPPGLNQTFCDYAVHLHTALAVEIVQWTEICLDFTAFTSMTYFIRTRNFRKVATLANMNMKTLLVIVSGLRFRIALYKPHSHIHFHLEALLVVGTLFPVRRPRQCSDYTEQFVAQFSWVVPDVVGLTFLVCYYVAVAFSFSLHVYFKILLYSARTPCDFIWPAIRCIIFRLVVFYCFICFSVFHTVIFIERALTSFDKGPKGSGCLMGILMSIAVVLIPVGLTAIPLSTDDFVDPRPYCFSNSQMNALNVAALISAIAVNDIIVTTGDVLVYIHNRRSLEAKHDSGSEYSLSNSFRMRETQISMQIIFPYAVIHAFVFVIYVVSVIVSNFMAFFTMMDKTNAILQVVSITKSIYLAFVPLLMIIFVRGDDPEKWMGVTKVSPEAYFDQFKQQW